MSDIKTTDEGFLVRGCHTLAEALVKLASSDEAIEVCNRRREDEK